MCGRLQDKIAAVHFHVVGTFRGDWERLFGYFRDCFSPELTKVGLVEHRTSFEVSETETMRYWRFGGSILNNQLTYIGEPQVCSWVETKYTSKLL